MTTLSKGDILVGDGKGGADFLAVGATTGHVLKVNSGATLGVEWGATSGSGDVVGPAGATDNAIVRFDSTTGKLVQDSVVTIADTTGNIAGAGTVGCGAITTTGQLTASVASTPLKLTGATDAKMLVTHASGLQVRNSGDTAGAPINCSTVNCTAVSQTGGAENSFTGTIQPGSVDATYDLGKLSYGWANLFLGAATTANVRAGVDVKFRNHADSAYQNIDALALKIGGSTVINSSGIVSNQVVGINFVIDGGGSAITTGKKGQIEVPFAMTITGWTVVADASGSIVVDVNRSTYSGFPTTSSIAGSELPTLSSVQKNQDLSLSTWTTSIAAGDILEFEVDSASTVTRVTVAIRGTRA